jgi:hypothetical protein
MAADRPEVLTSLPRSRPTRRSAKRGSTNDGEAAAEKPRAKKAAAAKKPAAKPKAAAPKAKAKAPAKATVKTKAKAKPAAKAKPKPKAKAAPARRAALKEVPGGKKPQPVSAGAPDLDDFPKDPPSGPVDPPSGGELLESAVKAAGEIAQAGVTVGREALKSITRRLPRP